MRTRLKLIMIVLVFVIAFMACLIRVINKKL